MAMPSGWFWVEYGMVDYGKKALNPVLLDTLKLKCKRLNMVPGTTPSCTTIAANNTLMDR
jgi:hypothetical protein